MDKPQFGIKTILLTMLFTALLYWVTILTAAVDDLEGRLQSVEEENFRLRHQVEMLLERDEAKKTTPS